ncbi:MAG: sigma-70 family RNA polymerase sigma factor [Alphaproteobacteria bacterium]|nr:sigma-70 family RNA polymerase sigma factor [Alphaproteobacteria bacterium]
MNTSNAQATEDTPSDQALVAATLDGSYQAFEELFRRYSDRVYGIALGMVRDDAEAQDVVQETFLNAFRKLHTFRQESPFRGWLFRIATNSALMRLRTRRRRPEVSLQVKSPGFQDDGHHERPIVDWSPLAPKLMENKELGERLRASVDQLPDKYRVVLMLADYEHLSMKEIADQMEISVPAVKTRLHRARLAVRADLDDYLSGLA